MFGDERILLKKSTLPSAFLFVLPLYNVWIFESLLLHPTPLWVNSFLGLLSLYIFLTLPKDQRFYFGFIVGLFWFYWVGISFYFFGLSFLVPIISIVVAGIYMLIFAAMLWFENLFYRTILLIFSSFIHPFSFDWFNIDSFFAYSYLGVSKPQFTLSILAIIALIYFLKYKNKLFLLPTFICLLFAIDFSTFKQTNSTLPFQIQLLQTHFSQDTKWQQEHILNNITQQFQDIKEAIKQKKEMVIFPETSLPFILEKSPYFETLKILSDKITIVIGSLQEKEGQTYNSTYVFQQGNTQVFNKVILAPFGEKIPLPDFLAKPIGKFFWGEDNAILSASQNFGYFTHKNTKIKSVICYEGTSKEAYRDFPKYMIVISNNAWFPNSIEPALQKNLMKYYARVYHTTIIHSSNGSESFVIFP